MLYYCHFVTVLALDGFCGYGSQLRFSGCLIFNAENVSSSDSHFLKYPGCMFSGLKVGG